MFLWPDAVSGIFVAHYETILFDRGILMLMVNMGINLLCYDLLRSLRNLDRNQISGTLDLPSLQNVSSLQLISLVNNSITDVVFPTTGLLSTSTLTLSNLLL